MAITNLSKSYKLQWKNWTTAWVNNTTLTWKQLSGEATTNTNRIVQYETWDSNTTTWATETRTWDEMGTIWSNTVKPQDGYLWDSTSFPWLELTPWDDVYGGITNLTKPV